jgi:DNA polymerase III delta subunit
MLHVFYGSGVIAVRQKAHTFSSEQEGQGVRLERIDANRYVPGICADIVSSVSLFGEKTVYLLDTPSADAIFYDEVVSSLEAFKESENTFVVIEGALLAPQKKIFSKHAETFDETTADSAERYNAFSMADSLSMKDKKTLWLQLQEAKTAGLSAEEIIGTLWWQLKTLRLVKLTSSASEAGIKDFPYNKAKRSLHNFKEGELETLSSKLLVVYHDGHLGKKDIDLALEKWTLTI